MGVASGSGWNLWVWLLGVVVRRYIDFLILLIPTPLVSVLFYSSIPTLCSFFNVFHSLVIFGLKRSLHDLGEHNGTKTELYRTNAKRHGLVPAHFALIIIIVVHVVKHQSVLINTYRRQENLRMMLGSSSIYPAKLQLLFIPLSLSLDYSGYRF